MNTVTVMNVKTKQVFAKDFNDIKEQAKFINKCDRGTSLLVLSFTWDGEDEYEYLCRKVKSF